MTSGKAYWDDRQVTLEQGWGFPYLAKKGHYFTENSISSLCGKWMFTGARVDCFHNDKENCVACMRKREKLTTAETGH